ncbi:hypothetical protein ACJ2A9_00035 [Anaerobacillus sp. MEB173]|uniref:hypothetical protein n=1 Tax=Anaerobacillus sp. MEB173 TaxID=3383345 RepID=UPI003F918D91
MRNITTALIYVDDFEAKMGTNVAWNLDIKLTLQRIRTLIRNPELIEQRALNACGPAVFFRIWFARDPFAAAMFACQMLRDGSANIGSLRVVAGARLRSKDYARMRSITDSAHPNATPEHADWMLLSSLRDSENIFGYAGEPYTTMDAVSGLTLPSTLSNWLNATGLYSSVSNETNFVYAPNQQQLLNMIPTSNVDIVLLVSSTFDDGLQPFFMPPQGILPGPGGAHIPNHYILVTAPFIKSNDSLWLRMEVWSWGRRISGWVGYTQFFTKYFGPIIATAR